MCSNFIVTHSFGKWAFRSNYTLSKNTSLKMFLVRTSKVKIICLENNEVTFNFMSFLDTSSKLFLSIEKTADHLTFLLP